MAQGLGGAFGRALFKALAAGAEAAAKSLLRSPSRRTPTAPVPPRRPDAAPDRRESRPADRSPRPDPTDGRTGAGRQARHLDGRRSTATGRGDGYPGDGYPGDGYPGDGYPGDFEGVARIEYRPDPDGDADPGEVVWGWVPFEEDHSQGKDRPVLVIGKDGGWLLALMLTSKDHDRDAAQEARYGRQWMDVGAGDWDPQRRPSEVRLDRVLRLAPAAVRREGGTLPRARFDDVADAVRRVNGWD